MPYSGYKALIRNPDGILHGTKRNRKPIFSLEMLMIQSTYLCFGFLLLNNACDSDSIAPIENEDGTATEEPPEEQSPSDSAEEEQEITWTAPHQNKRR